MPNFEEKFDNFREELLGDQKIHPGILVRMDQRLEALEQNPLIVIGRHLRFAVTAVLTVGAIAFAVSNTQSVYAMVRHFVTGR